MGFSIPGDYTFLGSFTWANRPSASANAGRFINVTDIVPGGLRFYSDGVNWKSSNNSRMILSSMQCPIILPSSGSIGNNGALTLTTALPYIIPNCFMYFPANAISAGSAAGLYFVQMTSTTVGTIFNNTYSSGNVTIPASPTAFSTTGPGAYTQTTATDLGGLSLTIPGGLIHSTASLDVETFYAYPNGAGAKNPKSTFGGTQIRNISVTTTNVFTDRYILKNLGATNSQYMNIAATGASPYGTLNQASQLFNIDMTTDQTLATTIRIATATDFLMIMNSMISAIL